jgi:hypothetical protein
MTREQTIRLALDIELDPRTLRGTVRQLGGTGDAFRGWLGLMTTLERLRTDALTNGEADDGTHRGELGGGRE